MFLALKEMKKEKVRFIMIILITALIAYLVYFLSSLAFGLAQINRTTIDYWNASGIVLTKSSNENIYASMIDRQFIVDSNLDLDNSINLASASVYINSDDPINVAFVGYNIGQDNLVAPIVEGRAIEDTFETVVSKNLQSKADVEIGDTIRMASVGREFTVVGFTSDSNYNTLPAVYIDRELASAEMMIYTSNNPEEDAVATPTPNMPQRVSAVVVYEDIDQSTLDEYELEYIKIDDYINGLPGYQAQVLTFGLMIASLAVISSIITGIFMYILTMQKKSIFGVLKIQGYRNGYIMKSVILQTILVTLLGALTGLLLSILTIQFLPSTVPVAINWPLFIGVTVFSIVCSFIGTVFSARSILKIEPLDAL